MRIVVNGQQAFGAEVLKALLDRGEDVVAVLCAPDREGRPPDPLKEAAVAAGIPVRQPGSYEHPGAAGELAELRPDLMVMAFVTLFIPEPVLNTPTHGSIQYHPSILPRHRGPSAINWAIIQGEPTTGLSIFWPDDGLDTGPVLLTKEVEIEEDDTLGSLYFDKLFPMGVEAMAESVDLVREGRAPKIAQDESQATYESWCRRDDVEIDWSRSAREVHDLIRGADPRPGAWTTIAGEEVQVGGARRVDGEAGATPGEVVAIDGDRLVVAAADGAVALSEIRADGEKVPAADHARQAGLEPGARLGSGA
ncbi:MAG: methionyl-tRNA formyltransferase [Solirubrobacteraceae bacterium]|nr:methionyl-tRNA formyltransferase [Solirubrobacteraceae bacterium]